MNKILILFAHPAIGKSIINAALRNAVQDLDHVTFHDLYETYPEFLIDVDQEQKLCMDHDVIIMQHPFYWYSTPALLKEWQDLVLEYNWAYGTKGAALKGKLFFQAITAGGGDDDYCKKGFNEFTICELTTPFRAAAKLCSMEWLPPFAVLGVHRGLPAETIARHARDYRRLIKAVRDNTLDKEAALKTERLNCDLDAIIKD